MACSVTHLCFLLWQSALRSDQHERRLIRMLADFLETVLQHFDLVLRQVQAVHRCFCLSRVASVQLQALVWSSGARGERCAQLDAERRRGAHRTRRWRSAERRWFTGSSAGACERGGGSVCVLMRACVCGGFTIVNRGTSWGRSHQQSPPPNISALKGILWRYLRTMTAAATDEDHQKIIRNKFTAVESQDKCYC